MAGGKVPKTGTAHVKKSSVGDNTVQDAVYGTSGVLYTRLSTLASGCVNNMIDNTYGTRNSDPTHLTQFRGYPKPEVDINWELIETTSGSFPTIETYEELWVQPKLANYIGFSFVLTIDVDQKAGAGLPSENENRVTCTFTFNAGSLYPNSTSGTSGGIGSGSSAKWIINDLDPATENSIITYTATASTNHDAYYSADGSTDSDTLAYASVFIYTKSYRNVSFGSGCSSTISGGDLTCYTLSSTIANGSEIFTDTGLTTHLANGNYVTNYISVGNYDYFTITSGIVSGYGTCTFP